MRIAGEGGVCDFKQVLQEGSRIQVSFHQRLQGDEGPGLEDIQAREQQVGWFEPGGCLMYSRTSEEVNRVE